MMNDLIGREALLNELAKGTIITDDIYGMGIMTGVSHAQDVARNLPAVDAVPVVHGQWVPATDVGDCCYRCSVCGKVIDHYCDEDDNYCSRCGTRTNLEA